MSESLSGNSEKQSRREGRERPVRVLIAAPSLEILGGQSRQAASLIKRLRLEPTLRISFVPHNPRLPGPLGWLQKIKYVRTVVTALSYWALLLVRVPSHDIVHTYSASYYSYLLSAVPAILIAKLYRKKVILNYHSGEAEDHLRRWKWTAIPTIRMADEVVVPSDYLVDVFASFGLQVRAISNIVNVERFRFRQRGNLQPLFLTSRLLESLYNVECVLRAFSIIQQSYPDARLTIAGIGPERRKLAKLARELRLCNAEFVGRIPYEEMPKLYDAADIYLTATNIDNMPGSVVECMASGLPVVSTDAGGIPRIVKHERTALLFPRGDHVAMAAAAIRFLEDSNLASRIAVQAREQCVNYSWSRIQPKWLELYHSLHHAADSLAKSQDREEPVIQRRRRVLLVAPSLDIIGGQSRQATRLIEGLREEQLVEAAFLPHNPRLPKGLRWLQSVKYVRTFVTSLLYLVTLAIRVRRYEIIHIFCASYYSYMLSALPAILAARMYGKRSILNYRSGEANDHLQNWRTAIPTIRLADEIVVPSGYLVDVFARYGLRARSIFNIIELDRFRFRERRPMRPVFLTSRLLEPLYNLPCVLRAFAIIQRRYPEAQLTVAADGSLRADLERLARDLTLRNTEFIGFVPFDKMPDLYDAADIYLTATNIDNMPSSVTECMAAGLNVVTTDGGGAIPYIMTNEVTGLIVERDNHEALAAAAIRLLEDIEFATRLARNARESCKRFSWSNVKGEWLQLYLELTTDGELPGIEVDFRGSIGRA